MLYRELLIKELNDKREDFARFADSQNDQIESYAALLKQLAASNSRQIIERIGRNDDIGALPSNELDELRNVAAPFEVVWRNHEAARGWAVEVLRNRATFAADGSQIAFEREINLPVAAIQVGTFENPHCDATNYRKQAQIRIVTPQDIADFADEFDEPVRTPTIIGLRRFQAEIAAIKEFLAAKEGWQERGEAMPLAFFDGTFLVSFSKPNSRVQHEYIQAARDVLMLSKKTKVPLIGYVAQSEARDLIGLLDRINNFEFIKTDYLHQPSKTLNDAQILSLETLRKWGERSAFFYCNRKGLSEHFVDDDAKFLVGFVYLQTASDALPARLDVPAWIFEAGLLDEVVNTVRAECVVGLGYPYALETADATAVITMRDRETFLRALSEFAAREKLNFLVSNKKTSKTRRR